MSSDETNPDSFIDHSTSINYWNSVNPDIDGMLGGFSEISNIDLRGSSVFLAKVRRLIPSIASAGRLRQAADCGAGIGRVTAGFLSKVCEKVDVVEPVQNFANVVRDGELNAEGKIGDIYVTGLEEWQPCKEYDLIWNQWCLGHLTDIQLVEYLVRCRAALSETGLIVIKENIVSDLFEDMFDPQDSSVTRTEKKYRELFARAGCSVVKSEEQFGFPRRLQLYPVRFFALRPEG